MPDSYASVYVVTRCHCYYAIITLQRHYYAAITPPLLLRARQQEQARRGDGAAAADYVIERYAIRPLRQDAAMIHDITTMLVAHITPLLPLYAATLPLPHLLYDERHCRHCYATTAYYATLHAHTLMTYRLRRCRYRLRHFSYAFKESKGLFSDITPATYLLRVYAAATATPLRPPR